MSIGISKRELLRDYYFDEISEIFTEYNALNRLDENETTPSTHVGAEKFFGM